MRTFTLGFLSVAALFFAGCSHNIVVRVAEQKTGQPVVGALVHRDRPASRLEKITNPVGTTYHPLTTAEARWTDADGSCVLSQPKETDILRFFVPTRDPLTATVGDRTWELSPGTTSGESLVYSVWQKGGPTKVLVGRPTWDWRKARR